MSTAAAAAGGGAAFGAADDSVYRAVVAHGSVDDVRQAVERSLSSTAVNQAAGANGETPLRAARRMRRHDLVCILLESGAEAGDGDRYEAVRWCVSINDLAGLRRLMELGLSVDVARADGYTHLMYACAHSGDSRRDLALEVFLRSSAETRRAVSANGLSALDNLIWAAHERPPAPWRARMIVELLAAGALVHSRYVARVLPTAAAHGARRAAELAACLSAARGWRAQEAFVRLSLDMGELRWAEQMVAARRARLVALEREMGAECDSGSSSGSESEVEDDDAVAPVGGGK